jgi:hypothetical protein
MVFSLFRMWNANRRYFICVHNDDFGSISLALGCTCNLAVLKPWVRPRVEGRIDDRFHHLDQ